jgi:hypothetical protein
LIRAAITAFLLPSPQLLVSTALSLRLPRLTEHYSVVTVAALMAELKDANEILVTVSTFARLLFESITSLGQSIKTAETRFGKTQSLLEDQFNTECSKVEERSQAHIVEADANYVAVQRSITDKYAIPLSDFERDISQQCFAAEEVKRELQESEHDYREQIEVRVNSIKWLHTGS